MKPANSMEEAIKKNLDFTASAEMRERIFTDVMNAQEESKKTKSALAGPNIRSIIMKSPITKLAVVMIIIVVALSIIFLDKSVTPAYGITDLPESVRTAKTIHIKGWRHYPELAQLGKPEPKVALENWIDFENAQMRLSRPRYTYTTKAIEIKEVVSDGEYKMHINHTNKSVTFTKLTEFHRQYDFRVQSNIFLGADWWDPEQFEQFAVIGEEDIDGANFKIWQGDDIINGRPHFRTKIWLSPTIGKLGRVRVWRMENNQWKLIYQIDEFEIDAVCPAGVFNTDAPAGYTITNTKETAEVPELNRAGFGGDSLIFTVNICLTLSNSSVIIGWNSNDQKAEGTQAPLFANLERGGALPKLPIELYALEGTAKNNVGITYTGRHLAYTQKAGKFYEWAIYVPEKSPSLVGYNGYGLLHRCNLQGRQARAGLAIGDMLTISDAEDFNTFVLGAMAALSDDGKAPEGVTYESVLQLTKQIRESLAQ